MSSQPLDAEYTINELFDTTEADELVDAAEAATPEEREQMLDDWEAEDRAWWAERQAKRSEQAKTLWGDAATTGRGAKGINSWLGANNYHYTHTTSATWTNRSAEDQLAIRLNQAMKFAADLGRIASRGDAKTVQWNSHDTVRVDYNAGDVTPFNVAGSDAIVLNPQAIREIGEANGPVDQFEANSIVGGQAIHDGGHARHTPANAPAIYASNGKLNGIAPEAATTIGYLIEDAFVEAKVLEDYPGYQDYLDDQWHHQSPATTIVGALVGAQSNFTQDRAIAIIQDMGRRYDDYDDEERIAFAALPEDTRRLLHHGAKIMDKGHNPALDLIERQALANQLIRLLKDGEIPPEDLAPGESPTVPPPPGDLSRAADRLGETPKGHTPDGGNQPKSGEGRLEPHEHDAALAEANTEREIDGNPWPTIGKGDRKPITEWRTPRISDHHRDAYRDAVHGVAPHVKQLAKALHFRASSASRQQMGQLQGRINDRSLGLAQSRENPRGTRRIFKRREILEAPKVHISLLVDVSGSTSTGYRYRGFLDAATMLDGALTSLEKESPGGVTWDVHGHTSGNHTNDDGTLESCCVLYRLLDPKHGDRERLGAILPENGNYDGEAVFALCRRLDKQIDGARQKVLLHLSDGLPAGLHYGGQDAHTQMAWVVGQYRKRGFTILTIYVGAMGRGADKRHVIDALTTMYGPENQGWVHVEKVPDLPRVVGGIVSKALYFKA